LEHLLNITWLVLSLGLIAFAGTQKSSGKSRKRRVAVAVALSCLIALLLFPVISMTDDLNSGVFLAEGTKFNHWVRSAELIALIATGLLIAFSAQRSTWADGSILAETAYASQEPFTVHLSRRPPPATR